MCLIIGLDLHGYANKPNQLKEMESFCVVFHNPMQLAACSGSKGPKFPGDE
jgi:hypothetical protein